MNTRTRTTAILCGLLCVLLLASGCITSHSERESTVTQSVERAELENRRQVLERMGTPREIVTTPRETVYLYGAGEGKGLGIVASYMRLRILGISHYHGVRDAVQVRMDPSGRVTSITALIAGDRPEYRLLPWGD